jgi:hypothetical protein
MKAYLLNAFSLNMVSGDAMLKVTDVSPADVPETAISAIGHSETAQVVSEMLGRKVEANRVPVALETGDAAYVVTLFTKDGRPFRPPEGVVMTADELRELKLAIRRISVIDETAYQRFFQTHT